MKLSKKLLIGAAAGFLFNFSTAQTVTEGIINLDSHKFAKAKQIYTDLITKAPTADNYFYLGNSYLTQFEPNFEKAQENFSKGLAADAKSHLNKIGMATVRLGKGDKTAVAALQQIAKDSREKDAEVLYRIGEALTMFDYNSSPDLAIGFLNKAVEKAGKAGVPAHYYYTLGDAYRLKKEPGDAMTAYDKAVVVAKNKASVYTRMGSLWMAAQQWKLAKENLDKALALDPTYAPVYRALANYNILYGNHDIATANLMNYTKFADEDPATLLEISKLHFTNENYAESKNVLNKVFDKVTDPIKYKLKAYLLYQDGDYAGAKQNMDLFMSKAEKSRIIPSDSGLMGLIAAGLATKETDEAKKAALMQQSAQGISIAKNAKDQTLDWDAELSGLKYGKITQAQINAGPTNASIEALKAQFKANPSDTNALFNLANAYQDAKNWYGAADTWNHMTELLPTWEPGYYSKGYAYQNAGNPQLAIVAFQKYIDLVNAKPAAEQAALKENVVGAYYSIAYLLQKENRAQALENLNKALLLNPTDASSLALKRALQ